MPYANWVTAILCNGLGRYEEALAAALQATEYMPELFVSTWAVPDLIEAAVRAGNTKVARNALERLSETARAGGTEHGLGLEARSRAVLSEGRGCGSVSIVRQSTGSAAPDFVPSLPAPISSTVSGCAVSGGGATLVTSCARLQRCSKR